MPNELSDQAVYSVASGEAILQMGIKQPLTVEIENVCTCPIPEDRRQEEDSVMRWPVAWRLSMHELGTPAQTLALLTTINAGIQELLDSPDDRAEALHALNNGLLSKVSLYTRAAGNRHQAIPPMDAVKQTYKGGICGAITENMPQGLAAINAAACWLLAIQAAVVGHLKAISS